MSVTIDNTAEARKRADRYLAELIEEVGEAL